MVRLLDSPSLRSMPSAPNAREPSLNGSAASSGAMNSARAAAYGNSSTRRRGRRPSSPVRLPIRDANPASFLGTRSSQTVSFFRRMNRSTLMPHVCLSTSGNRSCDSGMRISADQPPSSIETRDCHTASQEASWNVSLKMIVSSCTLDALTPNAAPVSRSYIESR